MVIYFSEFLLQIDLYPVMKTDKIITSVLTHEHMLKTTRVEVSVRNPNNL